MKTTVRLFLMSLLLTVAMPVMAEECETDADCPEGFYCAAGPSWGCACPGCAEGEECPPCDCEEPPEEIAGECVEIDLGFDNIMAGECSNDADCPVDFTCQEVTLGCWDEWACTPCACAGCDPDDEDCTEEPECECPPCEQPEECEETQATMCVYSPTECESDTDCAAGFECMELKECWGGGGGCACTSCVCAECPEGEECPPCECDEEPVCECDDEAEYEEECIVFASICFPKETPCETDADCAEEFMCVEVGGGMSGCACPDCACATCPEGEECEPCECPPCECEEGEEELETEGICLPGGWDEAEFMGGGSDGGGGGGGFGVDTLAENAAEQSGVTKGNDEEEEENPEEPAGGNGAGGEGGGDKDPGTTDEGGFSCTAGTTGSLPGAWLLLLALAGLATLRRRVNG